MRVDKAESRQEFGQWPCPRKKRLESEIGDGRRNAKGKESVDRCIAGLTGKCRANYGYGKPELALGGSLRKVFQNEVVLAFRPPRDRSDRCPIEPRHPP
ncbi:hypothetical protein GCM10017710_45850 [Arthrobacter ramosus]